MECPGCGRAEARRRLGPADGWCSAACRRRLIRRLRELSLEVARRGAAVDMSAEIAARDDLVARLVRSATARPVGVTRPPSRWDDVDDLHDVPVYGA